MGKVWNKRVTIILLCFGPLRGRLGITRISRLHRFRARLVVKGYSQISRQDFDQTFSPVMRLDSLRNLIAITATHDLDMCVLNVKSTCLHGDLDETIYMQQPEGFNNGTPQVCLLTHLLYGLKQSGQAWNKTLDTHLKELRYQQLNTDHCIYIRQPDHRVYDIFSIWVDDFAIFCTEGQMSQNRKEIGNKWEITDQGKNPQIIVMIQILCNRTHHQIMIHQGAYIQQILRRFGMANSDTVTVPMDNMVKLTMATDTNLFEHPTLYWEVIGALLYASMGTRPDIGPNPEPVCI